MSDQNYPEKMVRISGAGQSEVGRPSAKSALALTVDACEMAIAEAGLNPADIDGLATFPGFIPGGDGYAPVGATETMLALRLQPSWVAASVEGHAHMGPIFAGIQAISSGMCRHVLVFRSVAQATARAAVHHAGLFGGGPGGDRQVWGGQSWTVPFDVLSPAILYAVYAQAYFEKYGATREQLGAVAVNARKMAGLNPNAIYSKPITIDDYMNSRIISSPLCLYDCDTHVDGATAIVLSHRDAAKDLRQKPIHIESTGMALGGIGVGLHTGDLTTIIPAKVGQMLWSRTDLTPRDVDVAQIYDGFSILTLFWLEAIGLCKPGEAAAFVEGGKRIGLDGELPLNTSGGQLSAGRFHGYGHTYEACLQLWGRAGNRQVPDAKVCAVTNGGMGFGALLLRND